MYFAQIDAVTATLFAAVLALSGTLVVTVLNATSLETRRQDRIRKQEEVALRDACYTEIGKTVRELATRISLVQKGYVEYERLSEHLSGYALDWVVYPYIQANPNLFYRLPDARSIEYFYQNLRDEIDNLSDDCKQHLENPLPEDESYAYIAHNRLPTILQGAIVYLEIEKLREVTTFRAGREKAMRRQNEKDAWLLCGQLGAHWSDYPKDYPY
ncbi:MAG: hypothetical protein ACXV2D_08045 [Halobacteriota archaeon]